jgi:hypothetical protein
MIGKIQITRNNPANWRDGVLDAFSGAQFCRSRTLSRTRPREATKDEKKSVAIAEAILGVSLRRSAVNRFKSPDAAGSPRKDGLSRDVFWLLVLHNSSIRISNFGFLTSYFNNSSRYNS